MFDQETLEKGITHRRTIYTAMFDKGTLEKGHKAQTYYPHRRPAWIVRSVQQRECVCSCRRNVQPRVDKLDFPTNVLVTITMITATTVTTTGTTVSITSTASITSITAATAIATS
jgi:hypothetical protein